MCGLWLVICGLWDRAARQAGLGKGIRDRVDRFGPVFAFSEKGDHKNLGSRISDLGSRNCQARGAEQISEKGDHKTSGLLGCWVARFRISEKGDHKNLGSRILDLRTAKRGVPSKLVKKGTIKPFSDLGSRISDLAMRRANESTLEV